MEEPLAHVTEGHEISFPIYPYNIPSFRLPTTAQVENKKTTQKIRTSSEAVPRSNEMSYNELDRSLPDDRIPERSLPRSSPPDTMKALTSPTPIYSASS